MAAAHAAPAPTPSAGIRVRTLADADQAFLDSVTRCRHRGARRGPLGLLHRSRRPLARLGRRATGLLLLLLVMGGIGISGAQPASAFDPPNPSNVLCDRGTFTPERADQGLMSLLTLGSPLATAGLSQLVGSSSAPAATAPAGSVWSQYGASGTYWDVLRSRLLGCQ